MRYKNLGTTGLTVSEIGFGAWGIGGPTEFFPAYGTTDDGESILALKRAYDAGVTFYDTADVYGGGHSEELIGDTFNDVRDKVVIATKVGLDHHGDYINIDPATVTVSLEGSLRRLQTDYLDLYQLHAPNINSLVVNDRLFNTMEKLVTEGKVRVWGISVKSPDDGLIAVQCLRPKSIQVNFNLADQRAQDNGLFDLCEQQGVGIIVRTPLCFGFLTQSYPGDIRFDSKDHRVKWPQEQLRIWADASQEFTKAVADHSQQTPAQIALRFCLSFQAVTSVIPGMLSTTHVDENVPSSDMGPLTPIEVSNIEEIYRKKAFFLGPAS